MKLIQAIVKPFKVEAVREALQDLGVAGMTVTEVKGYGRQKGHTEVYRGSEYTVDFLPKSEILIAADDTQVPAIIKGISDAARTGKIGDGKIFVHPIEETIRIRTGESGSIAI
ncbi:MAG: P-II family nitrogen regulator [Opitutales bacterium]|nr:P-II family nitrogen regulator [Opitutales bacterium]